MLWKKGHTGGAQRVNEGGAFASTNPPAVQPEGERRGEAGSTARRGRIGSVSGKRLMGGPGPSTGRLAVLPYLQP